MSYQISPDGKYLAWVEDVTGRESGVIYIKELETGKILPKTIINTNSNIVWDNDSTSIYYVIKDAKERDFQLQNQSIIAPYNHRIIFTENDDAFHVKVKQSISKKMLLVSSYNWNVSESYALTKNITNDFVLELLVSRSLSTRHKIQHIEDSFYFYTNYFSDNFDLVRAPEKSIKSVSLWEKIISRPSKTFFKNTLFFKNFFAITERVAGTDKLRIVERKSNESHYIDFNDEIVGLTFSYIKQNKDSNKLRIKVQSNLTPLTVYDYDYKKKVLTIVKEVKAKGYDKSNYQQERLFVKSNDGTKVPVTLIYHKKFGANINNPLYLYVYGAYGDGIPPEFPSIALSAIDRGITFAVAHVRGGDELGKQWHEQGKLMNKKNTFNDFIAISQFLVDNNYVAKGNISTGGESASGMTIGVAISERPDLYKSVAMLVPFVDVLNSLMDTSLEYTLTDWTEFGDPLGSEKVFNYIKSYSPYDNIKQQVYPNIYVTGGLDDPAVGYWEPGKWVSKIRKNQTNDSLTLLGFRDGGHISTGKFVVEYEFAKLITFILVTNGRG